MMSLDAQLFLWLNHVGALLGLDTGRWWASELGKGEYATAWAAVLLWTARRRIDVAAAGALVMAALLAGGLTEGIKHAVDRPRPLATLGQQVHVVGEEMRHRSFPSGHSACAGALWACAASLVRTRKAWALGGVLAALVMLSRIMVGAHYPADVLVGGLLGAGGGWASARALQMAQSVWQRRAGQRHAPHAKE